MVRKIFFEGLLTALCGALAHGPVSALEGQVTADEATVFYTIDEVARFDGPGCASLAYQFRNAGPESASLEAKFDLAQTAAKQPYKNTVVNDEYLGIAKGEVYDEAHCIKDTYRPVDGNFTLTGYIQIVDIDDVPLSRIEVPPTPVTVQQNRSRFTGLKVLKGGKWALPKVVGKATAKTLTQGVLGVSQGTVVAQVRDSGRWVRVGSAFPDRLGRFTIPASRPFAPRAKVRLQLRNCGWCTDTSGLVRVA